MNHNVKARARIQITVEIDSESPWGATSVIGQLYDQASKEAVEKLMGVIRKQIPTAKIIGDPKVISVITDPV